MAGIGFELRKLLRGGSLVNIAKAYGYAGIISAGPWVISIFGIICLDFLKYSSIVHTHIIQQFQVSITYLIALSLIGSSPTQHSFTRYVADKLFEKKIDAILPSFCGTLVILTIISGILAFVSMFALFPTQPTAYKILMASSFVILCNIWFATNLLSGLKNYKSILFLYFIGYASTVLLGFLMRSFEIDGLLLGFLLGQFILLAGMLIVIFTYYPSGCLINFDFFKPSSIFLPLVFTSLFYNLGIWVDKFIFWFSPLTSNAVIGPLRASIIYDIPIFLAYLAIIPGMAIFLFRMETDFVDYYSEYYHAIRSGDTLFNIVVARHQMINAARQGIFDIIRIQALVIFAVFALGPKILSILGISAHYLYLLNIDVIGTSLLVVFLALLNIIFYLDRKKWAIILTGLFFSLNFIFTLITVHLGIFYFGYGLVAALLVVCTLGAILLDYDFSALEYITFMNRH